MVRNVAKALLVGITSLVKGAQLIFVMNNDGDDLIIVQRYDGVCDKDGCDFNTWRNGSAT